MKYPTYKKQKTAMQSIETYEGESIEDRVLKLEQNNEPIEDRAPLIYTEKKDGVLPMYDIRTDKWDVAQNAMDTVNKTRITKTVESKKPIEEISDPEIRTEQKN